MISHFAKLGSDLEIFKNSALSLSLSLILFYFIIFISDFIVSSFFSYGYLLLILKFILFAPFLFPSRSFE